MSSNHILPVWSKYRNCWPTCEHCCRTVTFESWKIRRKIWCSERTKSSFLQLLNCRKRLQKHSACNQNCCTFVYLYSQSCNKLQCSKLRFFVSGPLATVLFKKVAKDNDLVANFFKKRTAFVFDSRIRRGSSSEL